MELKRSYTSQIANIFLITLLAFFAILAFLVVSIGAKQYSSIADNMSSNYETRTAGAYVREKLKQNDSRDSISITSIGDCPALVINRVVNDTSYSTCIYCYDGFLYEISVKSDTKINPGDGQQVIRAESFIPARLSSQLFCLTIKDAVGVTQQLYVSTNSSQSTNS